MVFCCMRLLGLEGIRMIIDVEYIYFCFQNSCFNQEILWGKLEGDIHMITCS